MIALGEAVLTTGNAVSAAKLALPMFITAGLGMIAVIALWTLYFSLSDKLVDEQAAETSDPLRVARLAVNTRFSSSPASSSSP
ncbi:low temperature requirement protein A [Nocardia sp. NPDC058518]|uniref:low temperature requirement protein A n=1 Tax=Nocardia sp. NPDC058518 TaxID=3346534 RepID=UPI003660C263